MAAAAASKSTRTLKNHCGIFGNSRTPTSIAADAPSSQDIGSNSIGAFRLGLFAAERSARRAAYLPAIASARIRAVLSRMIRGSTGRPSVRALRTCLPEMNTGFSSAWFSIRSTRPIDS